MVRQTHQPLAGSLICLMVMLAIDFKTGIAAAAILFAVFQYLKRTSAPARWADSRRSYHLKLVRQNLMEAGQDPEHPRDWRPYVLALADDADQMAQLLDFAALIEGKSGITTAVRMVEDRQWLRIAQVQDRCGERATKTDRPTNEQKIFSRVISCRRYGRRPVGIIPGLWRGAGEDQHRI